MSGWYGSPQQKVWDTLTDHQPDMLKGQHPNGCVIGGYVCHTWTINDNCELQHWERHVVEGNGTCSCGTVQQHVGVYTVIVKFDATAARPDYGNPAE